MLEVTEAHIQQDTLSPFLPGTNIQYAWDSTSIGHIKGCPRLYQYIMIDGWQTKGESLHLRFGIEYHRALQDYDIFLAEGYSREEAIFLTIQDTLRRTHDFRPSIEEYGSVAKYKNRENLIRTIVWYFERYEEDVAQTHILQNGKPAVELSFRFELDWGPEGGDTSSPETHNYAHPDPTQPYLLSGHLDRVVNFNDELYVMDRKTTKSQPSSWYFSMYEPDNQMSLYTLASQVILNAPIRGVIIDAAQVQISSSAFGRGFTFRTKDQTDEWVKDLRYVFEQAERYAEDNYWPQNDKHCSAFRSEESGQTGCPFREVCGKSPSVREVFLKSNFIKLSPEERWNPLKPR